MKEIVKTNNLTIFRFNNLEELKAWAKENITNKRVLDAVLS